MALELLARATKLSASELTIHMPKRHHISVGTVAEKQAISQTGELEDCDGDVFSCDQAG